MKKIFFVCVAVIALAACKSGSRNGVTVCSKSKIQNITPAKIVPLPKEIDFEEIANTWKIFAKIPYDSLNDHQRDIIDLCEIDDVLMHFYSASCSWYCGGIIDTVVASSCKNADQFGNYEGYNTHDWNIYSAWVTNLNNSGVGESITYTFPGNCPRITTIIILNGYTCDTNDWQDYSRVKKLKMYYDGKPYAILELQDTRDEQDFKVGLLGYRDIEHPQWTLQFEILEVYPGRKYQNTAITELSFDGVDVH